MKIFPIFAVLFLAVGCSSKPKPPQPTMSNVGKILQGAHLLHQIGSKTEVSSTSSASYFLIFGSYSQSSSTQTTVSFAWQGNDEQYRFTTLPLDSIHVVLDPKVGIPYVKFRWTAVMDDVNDLSSSIEYAVITCNPKDWPQDIHMPNAGKE